MKWFRRAEVSGTNAPPTLEVSVTNAVPAQMLDLIHTLGQITHPPLRTVASPSFEDFENKMKAENLSLTNSIAGLTSVAECERDGRGRFAPRRAAPQRRVEPLREAWWMAL
jgi:hypothetical protein